MQSLPYLINLQENLMTTKNSLVNQLRWMKWWSSIKAKWRIWLKSRTSKSRSRELIAKGMMKKGKEKMKT